MKISSYLEHGAEHAIDSACLARMAHTTERALRKSIVSERLAGIPILSSPDGYFLPSTDTEQAANELKAFYRTMLCRTNTSRKTCEMLKKCIERYADHVQI